MDQLSTDEVVSLMNDRQNRLDEVRKKAFFMFERSFSTSFFE